MSPGAAGEPRLRAAVAAAALITVAGVRAATAFPPVRIPKGPGEQQ